MTMHYDFISKQAHDHGERCNVHRGTAINTLADPHGTRFLGAAYEGLRRADTLTETDGTDIFSIITPRRVVVVVADAHRSVGFSEDIPPGYPPSYVPSYAALLAVGGDTLNQLGAPASSGREGNFPEHPFIAMALDFVLAQGKLPLIRQLDQASVTPMILVLISEDRTTVAVFTSGMKTRATALQIPHQSFSAGPQSSKKPDRR
jgi:hypothetical protein